MISNIDSPDGLQPPKSPLSIADIPVYGSVVDRQTRCVHYKSPLDIIAIKFRCCGKYYPCYSCHEESEDHEGKQWEKEARDQKAILCGVCGNELSINEYFVCENKCPSCQSPFNPNCARHYPLYFEMD